MIGRGSPHAAMALPSEVGDEIAAVLFVTRIGPDRAYSELERGIADLLTSQVAIALQNADLHAQVAESALRDPLTGLLNRRFFDEAVEAALANARRAGTELSLIVLDLDHFSAVNNEHGHTVGDTVLRRVARAIKGAVREGDIVVRYGGEEFVVVAPGTDGDGAVNAAERIRDAAASSQPIDGRMVPVTIRRESPASSTRPTAAGSSGQSRALLAAKRAGRTESSGSRSERRPRPRSRRLQTTNRIVAPDVQAKAAPSTERAPQGARERKPGLRCPAPVDDGTTLFAHECASIESRPPVDSSRRTWIPGRPVVGRRAGSRRGRLDGVELLTSAGSSL